MTKEQAIARLKELALSDDAEEAHREADDILGKLLKELGYEDVVAAFQAIDKWYV